MMQCDPNGNKKGILQKMEDDQSQNSGSILICYYWCWYLFTLTDASVGVAARSAALVLLVPRSAAASEADCVGLGVSLTKALSTLGL